MTIDDRIAGKISKAIEWEGRDEQYLKARGLCDSGFLIQINQRFSMPEKRKRNGKGSEKRAKDKDQLEFPLAPELQKN